jgi:hypothetical protein
VLTTDSFRVLQYNSSQKPFVAFGYVPIADIKEWLNLVRFGPEAAIAQGQL